MTLSRKLEKKIKDLENKLEYERIITENKWDDLHIRTIYNFHYAKNHHCLMTVELNGYLSQVSCENPAIRNLYEKSRGFMSYSGKINTERLLQEGYTMLKEETVHGKFIRIYMPTKEIEFAPKECDCDEDDDN